MTSITSTLNAGSGIDTAALVTNLVAASFDPKTKAIADRQAANTAKVSSLATLSNKIDVFASALGSLTKSGSLATQPTSSNSAILTATAKPGARIGALSTTLDVRQLAQAQSLASAPLTGAASAVGQGDLVLAVGARSATVTIGPGNNTLTGLAAAINASGLGLTAAIVTDGSGARLTIKGATGAASAFTLTPASGADPALARFAFGNGQTGGMTRAQAAQDAIVRRDGIDITRGSNVIDDLVDGVTLNLVAAQPGTSVTLGATRPTAAISEAVSDFVDAYNELKADIDTATKASTSSADRGPLNGNAGIRDMQRQLARLTATPLSSAGGPATLAEIGVRTARDGTLSVDGATLNRALANDPDGIEAMFNPGQQASDPLIRITSAMGAAKPGTYQLSNIIAAAGAANASGMIAGSPGVTTGTRLYASVGSPASGLAIEPLGNVASATVTVDAGLGGALQAIRDKLRATSGPLASLSTQLAGEKTSLATQQTRIDSDSAAYKAKLVKSFSAMDTRVASYKATQAYLTQQIAVWTKSDS